MCLLNVNKLRKNKTVTTALAYYFSISRIYLSQTWLPFVNSKDTFLTT